MWSACDSLSGTRECVAKRTVNRETFGHAGGAVGRPTTTRSMRRGAVGESGDLRSRRWCGQETDHNEGARKSRGSVLRNEANFCGGTPCNFWSCVKIQPGYLSAIRSGLGRTAARCARAEKLVPKMAEARRTGRDGGNLRDEPNSQNGIPCRFWSYVKIKPGSLSAIRPVWVGRHQGALPPKSSFPLWLTHGEPNGTETFCETKPILEA
jgi:hypothetical protein